MSKKLLLILAALSFAFTGLTFAAVENIKVSGGIDTYAVNRSDFHLGADAGAYDDNDSFLATVSSLKFDADLTENVAGTVTIIEERAWGVGADLGLLETYVTLGDILETPITLKVGLQPLHLGSDLMVGDFGAGVGGVVSGATNQAGIAGSIFAAGLAGDLQYRKNAAGILAIADLSPLTVTAGYFKPDENATSVDDDENLYLLNAAYDITDTTTGELYYFYKDTQGKSTAARIAQDNVQNIGSRLVSSPIDNLTLSLEGAYQFAKESTIATGVTKDKGQHRSDFAALGAINYAFLDMPWSPTAGVDYAFLSQNWDMMYENMTPANIANALLPGSNAQVIGLTLTAQPREDLGVKLRYAHFRFVEEISSRSLANGVFATAYALTDNKDVGDEIDVNFSYDYTEDVKVGLGLDWFMPGDAFADSNEQTAFQAIGSMTVDF